MDPSENYRGTALEGTDAFQRQLKRFGIRAKGAGSSPVEKFFRTMDSAVLFPEYIARTVRQGMEENDILPAITATTTVIDSMDYRSVYSEAGDEELALRDLLEGTVIPETTIKTKEHLVHLMKRGRMLVASYEAIRFQKLDLFGVMLRQIGAHIQKMQVMDALQVLTDGDGNENTAFVYNVGTGPISGTVGNLGYDQLVAKIQEYGSVILMDIPAEVRNKLLKYCFAHDIRCYCVPKISDVMVMSASEIHLFDTALLLFRNMGLTIEQRFFKRALDILVSLILTIVTAPFMLIIALLIKLYDGGPVIFAQDRLTQGGKVFKVYKFRSMRVQNEKAEYVMTRKDDDRITPVGKILRRLHLDELPQIYNILKGDMSLVGPRPETPKLAEEYQQMIPEFSYRLKVKAGLTGFA
jgi:lipopolysaccharide/colanic/teichoic acid biosynthesis glycosyltransferase